MKIFKIIFILSLLSVSGFSMVYGYHAASKDAADKKAFQDRVAALERDVIEIRADERAILQLDSKIVGRCNELTDEQLELAQAMASMIENQQALEDRIIDLEKRGIHL